MSKKEDPKFKTDLDDFSMKIQARKAHIGNEETAKTALIIPFIQLLGYDISDPTEVKPEFSAAWGEKKDQRVDFAIFKDEKPILFIEAKPFNVDLGKYDPQLAQYFNAFHDTKFGILTNGEVYRFFTDTQKENVMDKIPFLTIDFSNLQESDYSNLIKFKKEHYDVNELYTSAETLYCLSAITSTFKDLLKSPNDPFVKFLIKSAMPDKVVTGKFLEKMNPVIKQAISNSISEFTKQGIENMQEIDNKKTNLDRTAKTKQVKK
ncbi:MAG: type I restriction enzyme HsdR N-terminal domain-containing protein [Methanoregula sp.]|nr:type I restriction enzyme HsdR N-terminal domain-containing protein [Methanoregula sp.]